MFLFLRFIGTSANSAKQPVMQNICMCLIYCGSFKVKFGAFTFLPVVSPKIAS